MVTLPVAQIDALRQDAYQRGGADVRAAWMHPDNRCIVASIIGAAVIARTPLHRLGGDEDLMGAAVFLASEASRHITGQYITVDGGASVC